MKRISISGFLVVALFLTGAMTTATGSGTYFGTCIKSYTDHSITYTYELPIYRDGDDPVYIPGEDVRYEPHFDTLKSATLLRIEPPVSNRPTSITIPDIMDGNAVIAIPNNFDAATLWDDLQAISFSTTIESIGEGVFDGSRFIQTITLPLSLRTIGANAFQGCTSLKLINNFPQLSVLTSIANNAFQGCTALESISLPDTQETLILTLGNNVFEGCTALKSANLSEASKLQRIPVSAFQGCTALTSVSLPNNITHIGASAFQGCSSLPELTLPATVEAIAGTAFTGDSRLIWIRCQSATPPSLTSPADFFGNKERNIFVPADEVDTYKNANLWNGFKNQICPDNKMGTLCTVHFLYGIDGVEAPYATTNIAYNGFVFAPSPSPTREHYAFKGWYYTNGTKFDFEADHVTSDLNIQAGWEEALYTVRFVTDPFDAATDFTQSVAYGKYASNPNSTRHGYRVEGWYGTETFTDTPWNFQSSAVLGNITLYAKWVRVPFTVHFDINAPAGNTLPFPRDTTVLYQSFIEAPTIDEPPYGEFSCTGYVFAGWYTEKEDYGDTDMWDFQKDVVTDNITLFAHWPPNLHTVRFAPNAPYEDAKVKVPYTQDVPFGQPLNEQVATCPGFDFSGWYTLPYGGIKWRFLSETGAVEEVSLISDDITLYAHWTPSVYSVRFNNNSIYAVPVTEPETQFISYGNIINTPSPSPINTTGAELEGWYTEIVGGKKWNISLDLVCENITLYAHWSENGGLESPTGVTTMDVLPVDAEYYDLTGRRIYHPETGRLYIFYDPSTRTRRILMK